MGGERQKTASRLLNIIYFSFKRGLKGNIFKKCVAVNYFLKRG